MPFYDEIKINNCKLIYKRLNDFNPSYIEQLFRTRNFDIHVRQTRHCKTNIICHHCRNETEGGSSFTVSSIKLWTAFRTQLRSLRFLIVLKEQYVLTFQHNMNTLITLKPYFTFVLYLLLHLIYICIIIFLTTPTIHHIF